MSGSLPWINVKTYGATGDGSTDDTTAITSAISVLTAAGRGVLYFPAGKYVTSGGFTISVPATILGDGMGGWDQVPYVSQITCTSQTAVLFTVSAAYAAFGGLSLRNTYAGTPSAGAAITSSPTTGLERIDLDAVSVRGFYDNLDLQGTGWSIRSCWIYGPVRYGLRVRNTVIPDAGDWSISDCGFFAATYDSTAAIRLESSGGGKITNIKTNMALDSKRFTYGIQFIAAGATSILLVGSSSFENYTGDAIHLDGNGNAFHIVSIDGSQFGQYGNGSGRALYTTGVDNVSISGCLFNADTGTPTAISLNSGTRGFVGPMVNTGFGTLLATSSFTSLLDHSNS